MRVDSSLLFREKVRIWGLDFLPAWLPSGKQRQPLGGEPALAI